jgi:hypothetical protein
METTAPAATRRKIWRHCSQPEDCCEKARTLRRLFEGERWTEKGIGRNLVGAGEQRRGHSEAEHSGSVRACRTWSLTPRVSAAACASLVVVSIRTGFVGFTRWPSSDFQ